MSEPLIFVTTATFEEEETDTVKALGTDLVAVAEEAGTGLVAYHFHVSEDGRSISNVQVHADAASMDAYLLAAHDRIAQVVDHATITGIEVFGRPGPVLQQALQRNAEGGVPVRLMPTHLTGTP